MNKIIKKLGAKTLFFLCLGVFFISLGLTLNFSIRKNTIVSDKDEKMATGDYFSLRLNNTSIAHGDTATVTVKIGDVNINSGDKGLGVVSFKLNYDTSVFSSVTLNSSIATITKNDSTGEVIAIVNNGNVITSTTDLMTISLKSNSTSTVNSSIVKLTDVKGSSGDTVTASDASGTVTFSGTSTDGDSQFDSSNITFEPNGNTTYANGCGTKVTVDIDNIRTLQYLWVEGNSEPTDKEFQNTFENGSTLSTGGVTGDYYLWVLVTNSSGNKVKTKSNVFKLDNKNPTVPTISSVDSVSNEEVGHDVHLTISGSTALSGIKGYEYSFNDGTTWKTYDSSTGIVITDEGITNVVARAVSNTNKYSSSSSKYIVNIKKEDMVLTYKVSTLEKTNGNVTVRITSNTQLVAPNGWTLYNNGYGIYKIYSENTVENVNITDVNGNSDSISVNIDQIDKVSPQLNISYNEHDDYVEAVITSNEELRDLSGWNLSDDEKTLTKIYYHNTSETVTAYDLAGNSTSLNVNVSTIQEGDFSIDVSYNETDADKVQVTITSDTTLKALDGWTLSSDKKVLSKVYTGNVSQNLTVTTEDNNKKNIAIKYYFTEADDDDGALISYSIKDLTNQSVLVYISSRQLLSEIDGWEISDDGYSMTKLYTSNTDETITVSFANGSSDDVHIKITNIDKELPTIVSAVNNGVYDSLKLSFSEDVESVKIEKDGKEIDYQEGMSLLSEGDYVITLVDKAGNKAVYNIAISKNANTIEVPDTSIRYTKLLIIIGILELLVGLLYIFKFKVDNKINLALVLMLVALSRFNTSIAADSGLTLNGYTVKDGKLYNIEATTTTADLKNNLDDDSSTTVTKNSSSNYVATGDAVKYKSSTYTIIVGGDVNNDGQVTNQDTSSMVNHLISKSLITNANNKLAFDYNSDGVQDISDLYLVNKRVVKNNYVITPKGIKANLSSQTIDAGHSATIEDLKVYPVNATNKTFSYKVTSGGSYSSVSGTKVTGIKAGSSTVRVSVGSIYKDLSYTVKNCYKLHVIKFAAADAMVLEANGHYGMIDTGVQGDIKNGEAVGYSRIDDYLKSIMDGERKELDFIILTHAHTDHVGNAADIIKNYGTKALYAKRYSYMDNAASDCMPLMRLNYVGGTQCDSFNKLDTSYKAIMNAAHDANAKIYEYGVTSYNNGYVLNDLSFLSDTSATKTVISLDAFTIKNHNVSDEIEVSNASGSTENINSLSQSIKITVNGNTMRTYLEGDISLNGKYTRSVPSGLVSAGYFSSGDKTSVKEIVTLQAYEYLGLNDSNTKLDVYKLAHHGFYNSSTKATIKLLKPVHVFATSTKAEIEARPKENTTKGLCTVKHVYDVLGASKFKTNFRTIESSIVYDYSSGSVVATGGTAGANYSFTNLSSSCPTLDNALYIK